VIVEGLDAPAEEATDDTAAELPAESADTAEAEADVAGEAGSAAE
jgi:hypothetical protein